MLNVISYYRFLSIVVNRSGNRTYGIIQYTCIWR